MANYNDKAEIAIGAKPLHKFPMHQMHLTTSNFMQFDLAFAKEFPKHKVKFNHQTFIRTMPLRRPVMGSIQVHSSAYHVPFRTVWPCWTDFIEDAPSVTNNGVAILSNTPLIGMQRLVKILRGESYSVSAGQGHDHTNCDYSFSTESGGAVTWHHCNYTSLGRHTIKLLNSLGYKPDYSIIDTDSDYTMSALPLLCAAKVYLDYYFPNQYAHTGLYANLDGMFQRNYIYNLSEQDLTSIFECLYVVSYASDYFTSAFDNPVGGDLSTNSVNFSIKDITLPSGSSTGSINSVKQMNNGTPIFTVNSANTTNMSEYSVQSLHALTDYIRRHALSGSRALERYLSDWGVVLDVDKLKRCTKISEKHFPIQVGEVLATADTYDASANNGAALGDFAGRGVAFNGDLNFEYDSDEFGYLIVVNTIQPDIAYYQGMNRNVMHKTKLDFLSSFDGLGTQPIEIQELLVRQHSTNTFGTIFGFTPRYAEYKVCQDLIDGAFTLGSQNKGLLGFMTAREFAEYDDENVVTDDPVHGINFVLGNDYDQYNRVFFDDEDDADKFIIVHRSNFEVTMPAVPLYDTYDWDEGKRIRMDVNGVKSN